MHAVAEPHHASMIVFCIPRWRSTKR